MGQTTQLRRDAFGQVVEEVDAAGNSRYQEYNEAGQIVRSTDCSGRITRYRYHPLGWLVAETAPTVKRRATATTPQGVRYSSIARKAGRNRSNGTNGLPVKHAGADGKKASSDTMRRGA
jgi:YD repeat-containing protein